MQSYAGFLLATTLLAMSTDSASAQPTGTWIDADPGLTLNDAHLLGAAARLGNGKVVAAGGLIGSGSFPGSTSAHVYDPAVGAWTAVSPLNAGRWSLDAITLNNGKALFPGGSSGFVGGVTLATAEVFDPATNTFSFTANNLSVARHASGITTLNDGRILITGGSTIANSLGGSGVTAVDIYDPATNSFTAVASMNAGRSLHAQVTLADGRVVVVGGAQNNAEVYDPATNTWSSSLNTLPTTLKDMKAFELFDGMVFIPGGQNTVDGVTTDATWFFDPDTGLFAPGPSMAGFNYAPPGKTVQVGISDYSAFDLFASDPSRRGRYILVAGGEHDPLVGPDVELYSASIYDAALNAFFDVGPMPVIHDDHTEADLGINAAGNPEVLLLGGNRSLGTSIFEFDAPNRNPIADAGDDQTVECEGPLTSVNLDGTFSFDPDDDAIAFEWSVPDGSGATLDDPTSPTPTGEFPEGATLVTLTVIDVEGATEIDDVLITVQDTTAPVAEVITDVTVLWPPNHSMRTIGICLSVSDNCANPEDLLVSGAASSSEPDDGAGDGNTTGDVDGFDGFTQPVPIEDLEYDAESGCYFGVISLRAERAGNGPGRVYSIVFDVVDPEGNGTTASCEVVVPKNKSK
jgi:hypothetical protein